MKNGENFCSGYFFSLVFLLLCCFFCFGLHKNAAASFGALTGQGFKRETDNNKMNTSSVPSHGLKFLHWFLRKPVCACLCKPLALHPLQGMSGIKTLRSSNRDITLSSECPKA